MAFCLDLAPDHLRKILGSSIHTSSPCLFSYDNKFCIVETSIAFCIMQLAGTVSIRAHLDADVKSSELVGAALQLLHRCWSKGLALQLREIDGCGCLEWQQWGLQTLRAMGSVSVAWQCTSWPHRAGVYNSASGNIACILQNCHYHPEQLPKVTSHPACSCNPSWFLALRS